MMFALLKWEAPSRLGKNFVETKGMRFASVMNVKNSSSIFGQGSFLIMIPDFFEKVGNL